MIPKAFDGTKELESRNGFVLEDSPTRGEDFQTRVSIEVI